MPQPLSKVKSKASVMLANSGILVFNQRPFHAILAMEAIASWSHVESFLLNLYLQLLGGPDDKAAIAYLAIETQSAKTASIRAVAKQTLSTENFNLLAAILAVAKANQKSRDKLAHHAWGISPDLPNSILLVDPKALIKSPISYDEIYVYNTADFETICNANNRLCGHVLNFLFITRNHPANAGGELYAQLCAVPEIREKLGRPA